MEGLENYEQLLCTIHDEVLKSEVDPPPVSCDLLLDVMAGLIDRRKSWNRLS